MSKKIDMKEIKFASNETFKVFVRPPKDRPMGMMQIHNMLEIINSGAKIIYVPNGVEFIVVKNDGTAKVY